jgi:cell division protein FtsB
VKELFRDLVTEIKALKNASMFLKAQIAEKAVIKAAQTMESMIEEIDTLKARVKELEGGDRG